MENEVPQEIEVKKKADIKLLNVTQIYRAWKKIDVGSNFNAWAKHTLDVALDDLEKTKKKETVDGQGEIVIQKED